MFKKRAWLFLSLKTVISPTFTGNWGSSRTNMLSPSLFSHENSFSFRTVIAAFRHRWPIEVKIAIQQSYRNGFSPVCVRMCFLRSLCVVKYLLQPSDSQLNVFPVWSLWCAFNLKSMPKNISLMTCSTRQPLPEASKPFIQMCRTRSKA